MLNEPTCGQGGRTVTPGRQPDNSGALPDQGDVALLIDYENLQISLKRHFNLTTPQMSLIVQEAQELGRLVLARAYAPWTSPDLAIDAENLYRQGIEPIYVPSRKNSADVRLAVDAVETAVGSANIATFVIVTGDGDLIHPINFLRQHGRRVVVIGVDLAMSRMLSAAADAVLLYERDLDPSVRDRRVRTQTAQVDGVEPAIITPEPPRPSLTPLHEYPPAETAFDMVRETIARRSEGDSVLFQELGHWLGQDHGLKPRVWYGVPFSVFMEAAATAGYVTITTSGGNSYAALPETRHVDSNDDDDSLDEDHLDQDPGQDVYLESLRLEERRDLLEALTEIQSSKRGGYLTFRTALNHLMRTSVLPRLSEAQIRRLLNDLADREPPILQRTQRRSRNASGSYTFSAFMLAPDNFPKDL